MKDLDIDFVNSSVKPALTIIYKGIKYKHNGQWSGNTNYFAVGDGISNGTGYDPSTADGNLEVLETVCGISVTTIADKAFNGAGESKTITLPKTITTITNTSFVNNQLSAFAVASGNTSFSVKNGVLFDKTGTTLISYPLKKSGTSYTIPEGVTTIGQDAFNSHQSLVSITIPTTVETIGQSAFQSVGKNTNLTVTINHGSKLKTIARNAFYESGVSSITLPEGITTIGEQAFKNCNNLTSINLPVSLTAISASAFENCRNLTTLNFADSYNGLTIGEKAFYNCKLKEEIYLKEGMTTIGANAFNYGRDSFTSDIRKLYLPSTATFTGTIANDYTTIYRKISINFEEGSQYATYYSTMDLALPENNSLKAYAITCVNGTDIDMTELHYIHANKAVLLEKTGNLPDYYTTPDNTTVEEDEDKNIAFGEQFVGTNVDLNISSIKGDKYVLEGDKFVKTHQGTLPAFRCYLVLNNGEGAEPSTIYIKDTDNNTYIYLEENKRVNYEIGTASLTKEGSSMKLTVTPGDNYYAEKGDITVRKNTTAARGRAASLDNTTYTLVGDNSDPSALSTYTFDPAGATVFEVTVNFHKRFSISDTSIGLVVTLGGATDLVYDGKEKKPEIQKITYIKDETTTKVPESDYEITGYETNINAGTGIVNIKGIHKAMGSKKATFLIAKRDINKITVDAITAKTFTGSDIEPTLKISDIITEGGESVIKETDYTITYGNNRNVTSETQKAKVNITAKDNGNYQSSKVVDFTILPKEMTGENVADIDDQTWTGKAVTPELSITYLDNTFKKKADDDAEYDYDVEYKDNINSGIATATITFSGNYTGTVEKKFGIKDHDQAISVNFDNPDNQWTTYYYEENLALTDGLKAYVVTGLEGKEVKTEEVSFIPRNIPVLLYSESGEKSFDLTTSYSKTLTEDIKNAISPIFQGTETNIDDIKGISGTKFVLLNGKFVQAAEGTLAANRAYLVIDENDAIDGVTTLDISKSVNSITTLNHLGNKDTGIGSVEENTKGILTITPKKGFYVTADDINIVRNANSHSARAPQIDIDGGKVIANAGTIVNNDDYTSTYTFAYDYNAAYQYQIIVKFRKATNITESGTSHSAILEQSSYEYDKTAKTPKVSFTFEGQTLVEGEDFVVSYKDNVNAGTGKVLINGIRKYTAEVSENFKITQRDIKKVKIEPIEDYVYIGKEIVPELTISDIVNEENIISDEDYNISYKNNMTVGKATVTITAKRNYQQNTTVTFNIVAKEVNNENVDEFVADIPTQAYNRGNEIMPALTIKYGDLQLVEGTDYDVTYKDNTEAGEATADITFKGNYTGTVNKKFTIIDNGLDEKVTVKFDSNNEWTTYYSPMNLTLTDDLEAYVITNIKDTKVSTQEVKFIPKNVPVLLHRKSGDTSSFDVKTCSGKNLDEGTTLSPLFKGTETDIDISTISGTTFVLLNGKFVQTAEGTLAANRCYLVADNTINGVTTLTIESNGTVNDIIYQEEGVNTKASIGKLVVSTPKDGKVTLTVYPKKGYYINNADDITIIKYTNAVNGRAPRIDEGKVTATAGKITDNDDYTSTYEFTYPLEKECQYQITVNFHKATNIQEQGKQPTITFAETIYNGLEQKAEPTVTTYDGVTLKKDVDYVLSYPDEDYTNAGKNKTVKVNGIHKYTNELTRTYNILQRNVSELAIDAKEGQPWTTKEPIPMVVYTGADIELAITDVVKNADNETVSILAEGDITITYSNNKNVGTASVAIKANENTNYTGKRTFNYEIIAKKMTANEIADIAEQKYSGSEIKPTLTIKNGNITLTEGEDKDYTVAYSNNIIAGEATATVTFRGNYTGTAEKKFNIVDVAETLTINFDSDNSWATYYGSKNLTLPNTVKAYVVTGLNGQEVTPAQIDFIPQETPVLLHRNSGTETSFSVTTCSAKELDEGITPASILKGTLEDLDITSVSGTKFVLFNDKFIQTNSGTLKGGRCYLTGTIDGVSTLTIGKGISDVITKEEGKETNAVGTATVSSSPDMNSNLTLTVKPNSGFYADKENLKVVYSTDAGSARAPEVAGGEVALTPVEGYTDTGKEFKYTFPYTKGYYYQVTVDFQKCVNFQTKETQPTITLEEGTFTYDGTEKKPKVVSVTVTSDKLVENKDYVVSYENNINAGGEAKATITGINHYSSQFNKYFRIAQRDINLVKVEAVKDQTYTGTALEPTIVVTDIVKIDNEEVELLDKIEDKPDYQIVYADNTNVGTAQVSIVANSINYTGTKTGITFNILPKDLSLEENRPTITVADEQYYTGEPLEPELIIKDGDLLVSTDNYDVEYSNNINETTDDAPAIADITFKGNYKGTVQTTFAIKFKEEKRSINIDFGANNEWTTYYSPIDLKDVDGVNIFVVTGLNKGKEIDLKTEQISFIPKYTGLLLQRTDKSKTTFTGTTMPSSTTLEGVTPDADLFRGSSTGIEDLSEIEGIKYILLNDHFVQAIEGALPANRCYVHINNNDDEGINHVDEDNPESVIILEEGKSSKTAGKAYIDAVDVNGYKSIIVHPASATYVTKDEIKVVRSIKNPEMAASRNRAPGIENTPVEIIPVDPLADPSNRTEYKFKYDSDYYYQVTVNFQKRINLYDKNSNPKITLKAEDIKDLVYDGSEKKPAVENFTCYGIEVDPINYTISYEDNINAGTPRVVITGRRCLMGETHVEFSIGKRDFDNVTVKEPIPDQEYTGSFIVPKGIVLEDIVDGKNIVNATDYKIVCNDIEIGPAEVSFLPENNYQGKGKGPFSFNIIPATDINQITVDELEGQWFDLSGQRIEGRPTQKGIYILRSKNKKIIKVRIK